MGEIERILNELQGKDINEIMAIGRARMEQLPHGGGAPVAGVGAAVHDAVQTPSTAFVRRNDPVPGDDSGSDGEEGFVGLFD